MLFYSLTIFLSAFLLFEVQPVIAKMILPWFGGSSAVWSTCMLFFQVVLLLGYLYAHVLNQLPPRRQAIAHISMLALSLATLPIIPNASWKAQGMGHPSFTILMLLSVTVGLPYFLLSSTSPLLQAWYARTHRNGMPYRLFALSNFASLLALLTYPFVVEPRLPSRTQALAWTGAFAVFAAICGLTAWRTASQSTVTAEAALEKEEAAGPAPGWRPRLLWLGLATCASVLLLAVTNHMTQDVAAIPFLWILPLTVYLLSFILCFEMPRVYQRGIFVPLVIASLWFMADRVWLFHQRMPARPVIALLAVALFVCCMACHGELARLKPHPKYLTSFYVIVSLGGAFGGIFVGLVAPNLFRAYYEFPIGLALTAVVLAIVFVSALWQVQPGWKWAGVVCLSVMAAGFLYFNGLIMHQMVSGCLLATRNFYGQLRVRQEGDPATDEDALRRLIHGTINHGEQYLREPRRREPVTYFCPESGIGRGMEAQEGKTRRIGILGLGCGTLAAYGRPGDTLRIYEINPQVLEIANNEFTYIRDTPAKVEVALGDGRLLLESEPSQHFDMLVMDAFSGDSVPVHLITKEAFATYFRHLKADGILAVNISNAYLDLEPVMERAASAFGKLALAYHYTPTDDSYCFSCSWALIMDRSVADAHPQLLRDAKVLRPESKFRIWTDEFSNIFGILK